MFFSKKKKEEKVKELPIDEIKGMSKKGMSDRDIIKTLKSKGYSYEDIEKGMLQAVKTGVDESEPQPSQKRPVFEDFSVPSQQEFQMEEMPEFGAIMPEEQQSSELMMEELIESVIEDKTGKYEAEIKKMKESIDSLKNDIKAMEQRIGEIKSQPGEPASQEVTDQLEDLQARVGGLERAFKQFLPSLTKNIEALSKMIHEMKQRPVEKAYPQS
ncbi:MAG: hypothetical protein QMD85_03710 [Candidatus Aenigmarchaeota archaeon]|nr:hypothetical protein [Candidatus Aenigmarchaeota archaeon]MDI6722667.1 hypothetical protein [Candidatus Aenigmarchaeota archaeon]